MKNLMLLFLLLGLSCANAQGVIGRRSQTRARVADPGLKLCGNVPEEHQAAVRLQLLRKARPQAELETCERFNVVIDPDAWTNTCGRAVIIYDAYRRVSKYDQESAKCEAQKESLPVFGQGK